MVAVHHPLTQIPDALICCAGPNRQNMISKAFLQDWLVLVLAGMFSSKPFILLEGTGQTQIITIIILIITIIAITIIRIIITMITGSNPGSTQVLITIPSFTYVLVFLPVFHHLEMGGSASPQPPRGEGCPPRPPAFF